MRKTYLEINLKEFENNIEKIKKYIGNKEIMPVIKSHAYGTYINKNIKILNKFNIVAVALIDEAIELRKIGYKKNIFVLNQPDIHEIELIEKYNIIIGLSEESFLNKMIETNKEYKIHLEIETGMNRTGININDLERYISKIKQSKIIIEGIYSHLSSADYDKEYTEKQIGIFKQALSIIKNNGLNPKYIHISATNGILNYESLEFTNMIRPGLLMYGYKTFNNSNDIINTKPICKLKSTITFIKNVPNNTPISYSKKYITDSNKIIATIPIGYGDGFRRELSNKGYVIIKGKKAKIVGSICMDSCMVDITDINNVKVGDEVLIFDNKIITLEEIADQCNTINYEILCNINNRVPRVFIDK